MVLQEQTDVIVMLGDFIEKQKAKCAQYFPQEENVNFLVSDVKVQCITVGVFLFIFYLFTDLSFNEERILRILALV